MKKGDKMKKYGKYIAAYGSAFLISLIGVVWQLLAPSKIVIISLSVLAFIPVILHVLNTVLSKRYVEKINQTKVADMQGYMLRHRKEAENASCALLKKLQAFRRIMALYSVFVWLLAACAAILGGMLYTFEIWYQWPLVLYAGTIFYVIYARIYREEAAELSKNAPVLQREEYKNIYGIAEKAAKTLECRGDVVILLSLDCGASIYFNKGKYYIQLGIILLNILSEEELYCLFLHEFSHYSPKKRQSNYETEYGNWLVSIGDNSPIMVFVYGLFRFFDVRYVFDRMIYMYATSVVNETDADRDMAKHGNPRAAASMLLKINYDTKYQWESGVYDTVPVYAAEERNPNYMKDRIEKFQKAIQERHTVWDDMFSKEILANNASHPTLKMRFETLGIDKVESFDGDSSEEYLNEVKKALEFADKKLYEDQKDYEKDRKEYYLDPLQRVTEWEERGMPLVEQEYADLICDLKQIGRHEAAEALCDRVISELDPTSSLNAVYMKGCALIYRYDEAGVELIYRAIEGNSNYLEEGLMILGQFFCMTGREEQLLEYRERVKVFAQKNKDEYSELSVLTKNDNLSSEKLPDGMLERILEYIHSVDCGIIQNIYLVRKTISDDFFASVFVIHFYGGTDAQRDEIMHKIFRYLDSTPGKWQFSLFDYFECSDVKFDKIEGSLVYSKSNNTNNKGE